MKRSWLVLPLIALVGATFLCYGNVWSFAFVYDDEFLIQKNTFLTSFETFFEIFTRSSTGGAGFTDSFYRPVQIVAYLITEQIFGSGPFGFHLLNTGLHAINACLLFLFARRLGLKTASAFLPALLWAVHPIHTEAITYKSGTADPLATLGILSAMISLTYGTRLKQMGIAALLFVFALLSKEAAVVFPGLVMTYLFLTREARWEPKNYLASIPFWMIAFVYLALRATVLNFDSDFTMYKFDNEYAHSVTLRLLTFLSTLPDYASVLFWPHDLHIDRDYPVAASLLEPKALLGLALLSIPSFFFIKGFWKRESKTPWVAWAALWFLAAYGPSSGILVPVNSLFLEHWMYLPSISLFIGLGVLMQKYATRPIAVWTTTALATAAAVAIGALTYEQNWVWQSPISLFTHILKYNPAAGRVRHNLAMALDEAGRKDEAIREYQFIIDHGGKFPQTFHNLGQMYFRAGQLDLAEKFEMSAIEAAPRFHPPYVGLSKIYEARGDTKKAQEYYQKALELVK